jgi:hypothetical protein
MTACCKSCGTVLSRRLQQKVAAGRPVTGLCAVCWRASVKVAARSCDCGAKLANRKAKRCHPCANSLMATDAKREARRFELMRVAIKRPEVRARRKLANARLAARKMAWLPPENRKEYFRLLKRVGRDLAKATILARMTPFERQLVRVREGVAVVPNYRVGRAAPDYTLGGVSAGML